MSDCLFCRFVAREIEPEVVAESDLALAFRDLHPQAPTHVLIVPKRHVVTAAELAAYPQDAAAVLALAAVLVVLTGIFGSVIVTPLMNALRIRDFAARGFAVGIASHGIGTARAFQVSEEAGTFAGIAMGLNGALTAIIFLVVPLLL